MQYQSTWIVCIIQVFQSVQIIPSIDKVIFFFFQI